MIVSIACRHGTEFCVDRGEVGCGLMALTKYVQSITRAHAILAGKLIIKMLIIWSPVTCQFRYQISDPLKYTNTNLPSCRLLVEHRIAW